MFHVLGNVCDWVFSYLQDAFNLFVDFYFFFFLKLSFVSFQLLFGIYVVL